MQKIKDSIMHPTRVVSLLINSSKAFEKKKKGQFNKNLKLSPWVTPTGLKPVTLPAVMKGQRIGRQASVP